MMSSINGNAAAAGGGPAPLPAVEIRGSSAPSQPDKPAPVAVKQVTQADQPSGSDMEAAVKTLNEFTGMAAQNVQFSIDHDSGKTVVKVVDTQTQEVLRQIPNADALSLSRSLGKLQGMLIHEKA